MKSLLITADFPPIIGGESVVYYNLFRRLPSNQVVVLAPKMRGAGNFDGKQGFKIYRVRGLLYRSMLGKIIKVLLFGYNAVKLLKKEKIEIIHCGQLFTAGLIGFLIKKIFRIPYFLYVYGTEFRVHRKMRLFKFFWLRVINTAYYVISVSEFAKKEYLKMGVNKNRIVTIYPGVEPEFFHPYVDYSEIVKKYKLWNKSIILSVSRLEKDKGEDMVIRALPKVVEKINNLVYLIIGEGSYQKFLKKLAEKSHLKNRVIFLGPVPLEDLPPFFNLCDVFIRATREQEGHMEGFGIVYLEANACAKPVIAGKTGGALEAVISEHTGLFVNPAKAEEISTALIRLLTDKALSRRLGKNGRQRVIEEFTWAIAVGRLSKFLDN